MFNIKFPIRLIIFLILTVIVNVFSTVTIEYNAISFQEYRNVEIICGNLFDVIQTTDISCLLYTSPSPRDLARSRMPSSA